jgi:hypothetical protein
MSLEQRESIKKGAFESDGGRTILRREDTVERIESVDFTRPEHKFDYDCFIGSLSTFISL